MRFAFRSSRRKQAHLLSVLKATAVALTFLLLAGRGFSKSSPSPAPPIKELRFELGTLSQPLRLRGTEAKQQLVLTAISEGGLLRDVTREVRYQISPASIARIDTNGLLSPAGDGKATLSAKISGVSVSLPIV